MTSEPATKLSVCIPVFNFGSFIGETLDSILAQRGVDGCFEVIVVDGASTDDTEQVVRQRMARWPMLRYVKLAGRGGIDVDLDQSVRLARGEYCWLFSGDDLMREGAMAELMAQMDENHDVYLCKHSNCDLFMNRLGEHSVCRTDARRVAEFSNPRQRLDYLAEGWTSEAVFSFMSGLVIRRAVWLSADPPTMFIGSCWAHVARLFSAGQKQLRVCFVGKVWLDKRGDNDSFMTHGLVHRLRIAVDGYHRLANHYFGEAALESFHVRRLLRNDLPLSVWLHAKDLAMRQPLLENRQELDRLMLSCYSDAGARNRITRMVYLYLPVLLYRLLRSIYRRLRPGRGIAAAGA